MQIDCAYAATVDDEEILQGSPVDAFKATLDRQQLDDIQSGCPRCFSNLQVCLLVWPRMQSSEPCHRHRRGTGTALHNHSSHETARQGAARQAGRRALQPRHNGAVLNATAVVLQAMWCAQTVPKCGSFDSVVAGAILPAMQKVRWRWHRTAAALT